MQPIFASIKPSFLTSLGLDIFDLGTTPPTIEAVNLVTTNEGVALDLQINFSGENNVSGCCESIRFSLAPLICFLGPPLSLLPPPFWPSPLLTHA